MALVIPTIFSVIDKVTAPMRAITGAVSSFAAKADAMGARAERAFRKVGSGADLAFKAISPLGRINGALAFTGITVGAAGATALLSKFVKEASKIEDATASFQSLLGSTDKAGALIGRLNKLGAATPFEFSDLTSAAQLMISFGAATEKNVIDKLNIMGDLAQGNAEKLGGITLAYSQIEAAGKASMQDVNQLINNGVPILKALADMWGVNVGAARDMVSQGKATSSEITRAFEVMTKKGGMFYQGMEIASGTLTGKLSTLQDNFNQIFAAIGTAAMPVVKEFADRATSAATKVGDWVTANRELIQVAVSEWAAKLVQVITFLYDNFSTITTVVKYYVVLLAFLRAVSLLSALATKGLAVATWLVNAAMFVYNSILGISIFLTGRSTLAIGANTTALNAYNLTSKAAAFFTGLWTGAQKVLNVVMSNNPIGWIIRIILVLIGVILLVSKNTEGWGEQWDATVKWMKSGLDLFVLGVKLQWLVLQDGFLTMVDTIVLAWKTGMNKLGLLSDQQYAADVARIKAEQSLRAQNKQQTMADMGTAWDAVKAGPGWHVRKKAAEAEPKMPTSAMETPGFAGMPDMESLMKSMPKGMDFANYDAMPAALPTMPKALASQIANSRQAPGEKSNVEVTVKVEGPGEAKVTKNPNKISVKTTSTLGGWAGFGR